MANTVSGFYQTLVTAVTDAAATLVGTNALLDAVYHDYQPNTADIGQTLNVVIPASVTSQVVDGGVADISYNDVSETTVPIVFNKHPLYPFVIRDFEQFNSPRSMRVGFVDAAIKGITENIDTAIAALLTTANFTTNSAISTTGSLITTAQFLTGYANLANQKVNPADPEMMTLVTVPTVYTKILGDSNWTQALIAGNTLAEGAHIGGRISESYGARINMDQALTSLNTGTAPNLNFTSAYFHKYAIAVVSRPLPTPDTGVVETTMLNYKGVPIRVMLGYNQSKLGWVVTIDAGYGLKVVREYMGQLFSTSQ